LEGQPSPSLAPNWLLLTVIYATPALFFVVLLPSNRNAGSIPTHPQVPGQDPSAGANHTSISWCFQPFPVLVLFEEIERNGHLHQSKRDF
jgi:hypothetical protein